MRPRRLAVAIVAAMGVFVLLTWDTAETPATRAPAPRRFVEWPVLWCRLATESPASLRIPSTSPWGFDANTDRGHQDPFVNGDGLRLCADFAVNETTNQLFSLDPRTGAAHADVPVPPRQGRAERPITVFFSPNHAEIVLSFVRNSSTADPSARFVLVSHNSDFEFPHYPNGPAAAALALHPAVAAIYAQNVVMNNLPASTLRKVKAVPIGLENRYNPFGKQYDVYRQHACAVAPLPQRKKLLLVSIGRVATSSVERTALLRAAEEMSQRAPDQVTIGTFRTLTEYLAAVQQHTFVAAPRGNGLDTHRAYDGWMMGSFVVTRHGPLDAYYAKLPTLLLDDWSNLTVPTLQAAKARLQQGLQDGTLDVYPELLTASYWRRTIFPGALGRSPLCPS